MYEGTKVWMRKLSGPIMTTVMRAADADLEESCIRCNGCALVLCSEVEALKKYQEGMDRAADLRREGGVDNEARAREVEAEVDGFSDSWITIPRQGVLFDDVFLKLTLTAERLVAQPQRQYMSLEPWQTEADPAGPEA